MKGKFIISLSVFLLMITLVTAAYYTAPWSSDANGGGFNLNNVNNITANRFIGLFLGNITGPSSITGNLTVNGNISVNESVYIGSGTEWISIYKSGSIGYFNSTIAFNFNQNISISGELNATSINVGNINVTGDIYTDKWQDYSGTSTITGWSSYTTKLIYYKKIGDIVYVQYNIDGASNSTSTWFSLPYTQSNIVGLSMNSQVRAMDNAAWVTAGIVTMAPNSANVEFWTNSGAAGWVSSGQKVIIGQFWYRAQ